MSVDGVSQGENRAGRGGGSRSPPPTPHPLLAGGWESTMYVSTVGFPPPFFNFHQSLTTFHPVQWEITTFYFLSSTNTAPRR